LDNYFGNERNHLGKEHNSEMFMEVKTLCLQPMLNVEDSKASGLLAILSGCEN